MKNWIVCLFLMLFLVKCAEKETPPPPNLLDKDTFTSVMIDVQLAEGKDTQKSYVTRNTKKPKAKDLYPGIFEKHNVDPERFLETYDYYTAHPGKMEKIYGQVLDSLSKLEAEVKQEYNKERRAQNDSLRAKNQRRVDNLPALHGRK